MIDTSAAKTGVNGKLAAWAFMILLANNPLPRIRFSANNSGTICLILVIFTRLTIPVIDLRKHPKKVVDILGSFCPQTLLLA
jgi:hypothetical protein